MAEVFQDWLAVNWNVQKIKAAEKGHLSTCFFVVKRTDVVCLSHESQLTKAPE